MSSLHHKSDIAWMIHIMSMDLIEPQVGGLKVHDTCSSPFVTFVGSEADLTQHQMVRWSLRKDWCRRWLLDPRRGIWVCLSQKLPVQALECHHRLCTHKNNPSTHKRQVRSVFFFFLAFCDEKLKENFLIKPNKRTSKQEFLAAPCSVQLVCFAWFFSENYSKWHGTRNLSYLRKLLKIARAAQKSFIFFGGGGLHRETDSQSPFRRKPEMCVSFCAPKRHQRFRIEIKQNVFVSLLQCQPQARLTSTWTRTVHLRACRTPVEWTRPCTRQQTRTQQWACRLHCTRTSAPRTTSTIYRRQETHPSPATTPPCPATCKWVGLHSPFWFGSKKKKNKSKQK